MEKKKLSEYMDLSNAMFVLGHDKKPVTSEGLIMASNAIKSLVEEVRRLEALVPAKPKVGDTVEITIPGSYKGLKGKVVNVEPFARRYPYSVEFKAPYGNGLTIAYFSEGDVRKVVG